jgi:hypothetical protein
MDFNELNPIWHDLDRQANPCVHRLQLTFRRTLVRELRRPSRLLTDQGQLFMIGFEGTTITEQVYELIEQRHIGSILLTAKNLKSRQWCLEYLD